MWGLKIIHVRKCSPRRINITHGADRKWARDIYEVLWGHQRFSAIFAILCSQFFIEQYKFRAHKTIYSCHKMDHSTKIIYLDAFLKQICAQKMCYIICGIINTLRLRQNVCHFPDDIFERIFLNENVSISLKISLKFVPKVRINYIPTFVQIMAWHWPHDKPLSEPMLVKLPMHICALSLNELYYHRYIDTIEAWKLGCHHDT